MWKGDQNDIPAMQGQSLSYSSMPGAFQSCSNAARDARTWAARFRVQPSSETRLRPFRVVAGRRVACASLRDGFAGKFFAMLDYQSTRR